MMMMMMINYMFFLWGDEWKRIQGTDANINGKIYGNVKYKKMG